MSRRSESWQRTNTPARRSYSYHVAQDDTLGSQSVTQEVSPNRPIGLTRVPSGSWPHPPPRWIILAGFVIGCLVATATRTVSTEVDGSCV
jgi:hypothetical protein